MPIELLTLTIVQQVLHCYMMVANFHLHHTCLSSVRRCVFMLAHRGGQPHSSIELFSGSMLLYNSRRLSPYTIGNGVVVPSTAIKARASHVLISIMPL